MKPIVFFQCGQTQSTTWLDSVQTWNFIADNKGFWMTPKPAQSHLYHFEKQDNKILLNKNIGYIDDPVDFVITKRFIQPGMDMNKSITKGLDIKSIIDWLNDNQEKSMGYGAFFNDESKQHVDIIRNSVFYTRSPWMGGHIYDLSNNKFITDDKNAKVNTVTWLYAYKLKDLPIYILVFNPSVITLGDNVEFENELARYRVMDQHQGNFSRQLLKPKMSKNAYPLEDKWYVVKGNEFTFDVGALSTIKLSFNETFDHKLIKVVSDLNIEHIGGSRYKAKFKKNQNNAYISIRFNTGNTFDWTFINSGNRTVYNINITKHYEEEP